jgi:mannose-1-phosphate guanylyltransferase
LKAFLLAAGEGRRLRPLTDSIPKCLVPIHGTPLLAIWLQLLARDGVTDVLVNLHYAHERVREFLDRHPAPLAVTTTYEPSLLGSAGTVAANQHFVQDQSTFLILYADNLTNVDLRRMIRFHEDRDLPLTIGVVPTDRPKEKGTVVVDGDSHVLAFEEKSPQPRSNLANAGIYVAGRELLECVSTATASRASGLDFGYDVLPRLVPRISAYRIDEFLMDIGTPESYALGQQQWPGL